MSGFSEDGQWWWDGQSWIATSQIVIPDLAIPMPDATSASVGNRRRLGDATNVAEAASVVNQGANSLAFATGLWFLVAENRAFRDLRQWTLQQLASAASYLLGPAEPMVAGETSLFRLGVFFAGSARRDFAILVTSTHVVIVVFDGDLGQPRRVALAARAVDVVVEAPTPIFSQPLIKVRRGSQTWWIRGTTRVIQPKPVVAAWKAAVSSYRASTASS